ncbi:MAG TPA: HAD family phosphatase [Candidatus Nanoarchaeia archaeon]|nr:HAD family phosphatase [Candidatus Nanoarchaeia archaeon]
MIKAVLFDLDGVLIRTEHINTESAVRSMHEQGIKLSADDKKLITGRNPVDYSIDFAKKYRFDRKKMIASHTKHYNKLYQTAKKFKYGRDFVLKVKKLGFKTALVTSSRRNTVGRALNFLGLKGAFDVLVTFEKCSKRKPSPLPYLIAARHLKVKPSECIVIEDSVAGVESAKRARMKCIAVTNSYPASKLKKADLIVRKLNDKRIIGMLC